MPRLFIGNFDFEHRLAAPGRQLPALAVGGLPGVGGGRFSGRTPPEEKLMPVWMP